MSAPQPPASSPARQGPPPSNPPQGSLGSRVVTWVTRPLCDIYYTLFNALQLLMKNLGMCFTTLKNALDFRHTATYLPVEPSAPALPLIPVFQVPTTRFQTLEASDGSKWPEMVTFEDGQQISVERYNDIVQSLDELSRENPEALRELIGFSRNTIFIYNHIHILLKNKYLNLDSYELSPEVRIVLSQICDCSNNPVEPHRATGLRTLSDQTQLPADFYAAMARQIKLIFDPKFTPNSDQEKKIFYRVTREEFQMYMIHLADPTKPDPGPNVRAKIQRYLEENNNILLSETGTIDPDARRVFNDIKDSLK